MPPKPSSRPIRVAGITPSAAPPSPYVGLANQIGSPEINRVRQTAQMAQAAAIAPKAPKAPRAPIRRIRVRKPKFAQVAPFSLPPAPPQY
jgi:hypothetical protein